MKQLKTLALIVIWASTLISAVNGQTPQTGGQTPQTGGQTPQTGGQTPQTGGQTPQNSDQTSQLPDMEARAVIGFEQAGASAAKSEQHFFFDFFIDRRLSVKWLSLWGNVRVASYPQQIDTPVAQFAPEFVAQVGKLRVNRLAETAEFSTGLDFHPQKWQWNVGDSARRRFGFIFSVGASGPFDPTTRLRLFQVPDPVSPQYAQFIARFPTAARSPYVGFIPPDRDHFYRSYSAGFRLTTYYCEPNSKTQEQPNSKTQEQPNSKTQEQPNSKTQEQPNSKTQEQPNCKAQKQEDKKFTRTPATYTATIGQDENVTGGTLRGPVAKFDVFYPLPLAPNGKRFLYLFGTSALRTTRASNITPFVLAPAPPSITGAEPSVAIIATPSNRDVYRIGVGVDAIGVICAWKNPTWCQ